MEALMATYGTDSDDDSGELTTRTGAGKSLEFHDTKEPNLVLPPPPVDLLQPPNSLINFSPNAHGHRIRNFPHVEGNYSLHVYIPVLIPSIIRKQITQFVKKVAVHAPCLYVVDSDISLEQLSKDDYSLEQALLGKEFHISLGRTVPIQVHQFDTIVGMLRQKLQSQRRYWIEFNKWEAFVNDDQTRSFLSLEVLGSGLTEIAKLIRLVDEVYRLHGLPEFYKNSRPHVSLVWALGDVSEMLTKAISEASKSYGTTGTSQKSIFMCQFGGIECKIGKKSYRICKFLG